LGVGVSAAICLAVAPPAAARAAAAAGGFACHGATAAGVRTDRTELAGVPAIVRQPAVVRLPPIVLWHGYGAPGSEAELMQALPLDDVPAVKVYLGLPLFGARAPTPPDESVAARQKRDFAGLLFAPAVVGAADELPAVVAALRERGCAGAHDRIGLFGFSAGGTAALVALADRRAPIGVAVAINAPVGLTDTVDALRRAGQPFAWTPAARALAARSDAVPRAAELAAGRLPPALLLVHGAEDPVVGPQGGQALESALEPLYRRSGHPERLRLAIVPAVPHDWAVSPQLATLRQAVGDWFNRFLQPGGPGRGR